MLRIVSVPWLQAAAIDSTFEEFDLRVRGLGSYAARDGAGDWVDEYSRGDIEDRRTKYDELRQTGGVFRRGDDGAQQG